MSENIRLTLVLQVPTCNYYELIRGAFCLLIKAKQPTESLEVLSQRVVLRVNVKHSACSASCNLSLSALAACHLDLGKIIFSLSNMGFITHLLISSLSKDLEIVSFVSFHFDI